MGKSAYHFFRMNSFFWNELFKSINAYSHSLFEKWFSLLFKWWISQKKFYTRELVILLKGELKKVEWRMTEKMIKVTTVFLPILALNRSRTVTVPYPTVSDRLYDWSALNGWIRSNTVRLRYGTKNYCNQNWNRFSYEIFNNWQKPATQVSLNIFFES